MWLGIFPGLEETDYVLMFFFLRNYEWKVRDKKNVSLGNTIICKRLHHETSIFPRVKKIIREHTSTKKIKFQAVRADLKILKKGTIQI